MIKTGIKSEVATHVARRALTLRLCFIHELGGSIRGLLVSCIALLVSLSGIGCGASDSAGCGVAESRGSVAVASSLTEWISAFGDEFEMRQRVSIAGSQMLRLQIENGARPDVFVSANYEHAYAVAQLREYDDVAEFVCNGVAVAYAKTAFTAPPDVDTAFKSSERVALAQATVPVGRYGIQLLHRIAEESPQVNVSAVLEKVVSYDLNVRQVLMRLVRGEADIGFVYASDIQQASEFVGRVALPVGLAPQAKYFIVHLKTPRASRLAQEMQTDTSKQLAVSLGFTLCHAPPRTEALPTL